MSRESLSIFEAVIAEDADRVREMVDGNSEVVRERDGCLWTPLHRAVAVGSGEIAGILLDGGADVNATGNMGETPLHLADQVFMARLLVSRGAKVGCRDVGGVTPFGLAAGEGNKELGRFLAGEVIDAPGDKV